MCEDGEIQSNINDVFGEILGPLAVAYCVRCRQRVLVVEPSFLSDGLRGDRHGNGFWSEHHCQTVAEDITSAADGTSPGTRSTGG
jgi:hypothetical protein